MLEIDIKKCVGCGACSSVCNQSCISMKYNIEGFKYPLIDKKKCIGCNKCKQVCPISSKWLRKSIIGCYVGYCNDLNIRKESTSGGIFSILAKQILSQNGIIVGAVFDKKYNVGHICIKNEEKLYKMRGSKYIQSDCSKIYSDIKKYLLLGKLVLFSGTNCQIAALKKFIGKDFSNLICVGIVCHGVASPKIWKKYLQIFHFKKQIQKINFRDKKEGWKKLNIHIKYKKGEYNSQSFNDPFLYGFYNSLFLRVSCYNCEFKLNNNCSDILIGDAWGIEKYLPQFENHIGNSLIIIESNKGKELFNEISDEIKYKKVELKNLVNYNPMLIRSTNLNKDRKKFYALYNKIPLFAFLVYSKKYV